MTEFRMQFTGWKAVAIGAVAVAIFAVKYVSMQSSLSTDAASEIEFWLRGEYASWALERIDLDEIRRGDRTAIDPKVKAAIDSQDVEVVDIRARGKEPTIARVEIRVGGKTPPDGKSVRYYKLTYSSIIGWRVVRETGAMSYYLKLF